MELEIYIKKKRLWHLKKTYRYEILDVEPAGEWAHPHVYTQKKRTKKQKQKILELILNCTIRNVMRT